MDGWDSSNKGSPSVPTGAFLSENVWPVSQAKTLMVAESYDSVLVGSELTRRVGRVEYGRRERNVIA
jgi:hypothetical protein